MILVTVGSQLPFDRLIAAVDAFSAHLPCKVFAQIGNSHYKPKTIEYAHSLEPKCFEDLLEKSQIVIAHCGVGSVLAAKRYNIPIVVMPRRFQYKEHRNDHQISTARLLKNRPNIHVAYDEMELKSIVLKLLTRNPDKNRGLNQESLPKQLIRLCDELTCGVKSRVLYSGNLTVGGLPIAPKNRRQWCDMMLRYCMERKENSESDSAIIYSINGQTLYLAHKSIYFKNALLQATALDADGQSLVLASRIFYKMPLPERVATTDLFHDMALYAQKFRLKFYFLGSAPESITVSVKKIRELYPSLNVCGFRHGYFSEKDEPEILQDIRRAEPDVLFIGLGSPLQELFVYRNREHLRFVPWIKTCGGLFDWFLPNAKRAPKWMQEYGLEWLHRALREPRRLFRRYLVSGVYSSYILLTKTRKI